MLLQLSCSIFVDAEAKESDDEMDESDDEAITAERVRQASESVPLWKPHEVSGLLQVADKWEQYYLQRERVEQAQRLSKRHRESSPQEGKRKAELDTTLAPRKRVHLQSASLSRPLRPAHSQLKWRRLKEWL